VSVDVLLVPDLPIERWPSMDRYASRLLDGLTREATDLTIRSAGPISRLTDLERLPPPTRGSGARFMGDAGLSDTEWRRYVRRYWRYPRRIRRLRGDVSHVLDHSYAHIVPPAGRSRPTVVTVHDLFPVLTVDRAPTSWRERLRNTLLQRVLDGLRRADAWIVATAWLRTQLAEWLGHTDGIHLIRFGVDETFFSPPARDRSATRLDWDIPDDAFVLLHVGSVGRRKNFSAVVATLDGLRTRGVEAFLVQLGGDPDPKHHRDIEDRSLTPFVRFLGARAEGDLHAAYHAADTLLFPSHYEGFGFPVLEAMASGLPVVTSGAGGLTEVAGDAAVIVGGREVEPYAAAVERIVEDAEWRQALQTRGRTHARHFRWRDTARDTARVYRALA